AVVRSLLEDGVLGYCQQMGNYFKERLQGLTEKYPFVKEVRGMGLILGLELEREGAEVVNSCLEQGFLINCTQERVLRFLPPLIVEQDEIDQLADCLDGIFQNME
ncbi:MAG: aspartate aminotransferase family protein, partial [Deltaproteobacteria bacterium]